MSHNLLANASSTRDSGNFVKAYGELLHDKRLSPQDVFLLLSMMWMADYRTGTLHASYRQIATQARCNTSDLAKRLDRLIECGYVVVKKLGQYGGRTPSTYFIPGVAGPRATQPAEAPTTVAEAVAVPAKKEETKPETKPAEKKPAEKPATAEKKPRLPLLDEYCTANDVGYYELIKQLEVVGVDPSTLAKGLLDAVAGKLKLARAREGGVKSTVGWSVAVIKSELAQPSKAAAPANAVMTNDQLLEEAGALEHLPFLEVRPCTVYTGNTRKMYQARRSLFHYVLSAEALASFAERHASGSNPAYLSNQAIEQTLGSIVAGETGELTQEQAEWLYVCATTVR